MRSIIMVQHAQSQQHTNGMIGSWTDWALTALGQQQAQQIASRLACERKQERYRLYTSDLLRTRQTAEVIAASLHLEPIATELLREYHLGQAVGRSKKWADQHALCSRWPLEKIDDKPFLGAESKREMWKRLCVFRKDWIDATDEALIIVTHCGTLSVLLPLLLGLELEQLNRFDFIGEAGGVSFLQEGANGKMILRRFNDTAYMQPNGTPS